MLLQEIQKTVSEVISKYISVNESYIFLFGSRADKSQRLTSDYDIGLYTGRPIALMTIAKIEDELEEKDFPVNIDIVDFSIASKEFKKLALKRIKIWNRPKKNLKLK